MKNNLPYPFNKAIEHGDSIDYRVGAWSIENDHSYVRKLGYVSEMASDCSYYAKGLKGFRLSNYGDWGTFYADDAGEKEKEMFLDMFEKDIIHLLRIRAYRQGQVFDYDGSKWMTHSSQGWIECGDPYNMVKPKELWKEIHDAIEARMKTPTLEEQVIDDIQKKMESLGPPPPGYKYEITEPRYEFIPEEWVFKVTFYVEKVPIE